MSKNATINLHVVLYLTVSIGISYEHSSFNQRGFTMKPCARSKTVIDREKVREQKIILRVYLHLI